MNELCELIVKWRESKGLTQKEASELAHVSVISLRHWENKKKKPRLKNLRNFAEGLGISYEEFLRGPEKESQSAEIQSDQHQADHNLYFNQFSTQNFSPFHPFSGISDAWESSEWVAYRVFGLHGQGDPLEYHYIYIDILDYNELEPSPDDNKLKEKNNTQMVEYSRYGLNQEKKQIKKKIYIPFGSIAIVREKFSRVKEDDVMLVYNEAKKRPEFIYQANVKPEYTILGKLLRVLINYRPKEEWYRK